MTITVGVLALQGGFREHVNLIRRAARDMSSGRVVEVDIEAVEVRTPAELSRCDALVIPGGESTAISLVAEQAGLMEPLKEFVKYVFLGLGFSIIAGGGERIAGGTVGCGRWGIRAGHKWRGLRGVL